MTTIPGWPDYRKASFSGSGTNCVAVDRTITRLRDTKDMSGGELQVANLADSVATLKAGQFDLS